MNNLDQALETFEKQFLSLMTKLSQEEKIMWYLPIAEEKVLMDFRHLLLRYWKDQSERDEYIRGTYMPHQI